MSDISHHDCDVLIIGAGGAGLRAAIAAHDAGAKVIVVSKSVLGKAHTVMAEGGIAAAFGNLDPQDNWKVHFMDTMIEGQMINNGQMVQALVQEVPERIRELEEWGAVFDRTDDGKIAQRPFGAHTYRRTCYIGDRTGLEILHTLENEIISREIEVVEEAIVTKILKHGNAIAGTVGVDFKRGSIFSINAKAIILATGGAGRIYRISSNSWETAGHGYALAFDAGAELQDMEMIQFHPTGMTWPETVAGLLVTEAVRGEGGLLLNSNGERFMEKYDAKRMELSARDIVARAVYNEVKEGRGTEHGGVWLDITHKGAEYIQRKLPSMYAQFKTYAHVDITKEKMEVAPTAHYTMGGIRTNPDCGTAVAGLFVSGEAANGVHGANRLGGNSLGEILVFGKRAGANAARYAKNRMRKGISEKDVTEEARRIHAPLEANGEPASEIRERMQRMMWENVGIVKTEKRLVEALREIEKMKRIPPRAEGSLQYNHSWIEAMQTGGMLTVCEAVVRSALERKESRGAHFREDYPEMDDKKWRKNIVCINAGGKMELRSVPVAEMPEGMERMLV